MITHAIKRALAGANNKELRDDIETSVDEVLAICDNDPRAAIRTLIVALAFAQEATERAKEMMSRGYARGGLPF
jgi:hypothetical protein